MINNGWKWLQINSDVNIQCTVYGVNFVSIVLVSQEIEANINNLIQLVLFVPEWPHWLFKSRGLAI